MIEKSTRAYSAAIWIAGNAANAESICRKYCMDNGLCVTVTPTTYVYTGMRWATSATVTSSDGKSEIVWSRLMQNVAA